jgi:hypothetical protein
MEPEIWRLHAATDDALLGRLTVYDRDFPWLSAKFAATPAFEPLRPLFQKEAQLVQALEDDDRPANAWSSAYEQVRATVHLLSPDGAQVPEFLLHIDGDEAWWRYSEEPFDE